MTTWPRRWISKHPVTVKNRENTLSMHLCFSVIKCGCVVTISFEPLPLWWLYPSTVSQNRPFLTKVASVMNISSQQLKSNYDMQQGSHFRHKQTEETNLTMVLWLVCGTPPTVQGFEYLVARQLWTFQNMKSCGIKWVTLDQPCEVA